MNSRQMVILLAGTIAIIFEISNAADDAGEQLCAAEFKEDKTITTAFEHAFNTLCVPKKRKFEKKRGILYKYLDHLYNAALAVYGHVIIEEPIEFCKLNINEFHKVINDDLIPVCTKLMKAAGYTGTVQEAIHASFYSHNVAIKYFKKILDTIKPYIKYTNAKNPKDFCNVYRPNISEFPVQIVEKFVFNPNEQYHQWPAQQNERFVFNSVQLSQPLPEQRTEYFVFDSSQQNHQPPALRTENVVFDSSSHYFQPQFQILNQNLSVSSPPFYPDEYSSFNDNNVGTSTLYMDYDKSLDLDLNKSPPK